MRDSMNLFQQKFVNPTRNMLIWMLVDFLKKKMGIQNFEIEVEVKELAGK